MTVAIRMMLLAACLAFCCHPVSADEPAKIHVALAGDSTVTDQAGWGKAFAELLDPQATCTNFAVGGRSSKSFRSEGYWKKVLDAKPDYVFIQFGHNDRPGKGPARETDPATTFREFLRQYVDEARAAGAKPILVTSLCRRVFTAAGSIDREQQPYVDATKAVAAEKHVPLVDLYTMSVEVAERLGPEKSRAFGPPHPKQAGEFDRTHLSADGAKPIAALVAKATADAVPELKAYLPGVGK